jgi:hypothetical protein
VYSQLNGTLTPLTHRLSPRLSSEIFRLYSAYFLAFTTPPCHFRTPAVLHSEPNRTPMPKSTTPKKQPSDARLRANRRNAQKSTGPKTTEGKGRSALNATRHGILSQVIHLPEEEMNSYNEFTERYVDSLQPVGAVETELANACADLQFRLHRLAAAEHNLFAIGHDEQGERWNTGHPESHAALTMAETLRCSPNPLALLTLYESRLNRRFLQTLKQLRDIQKDRHTQEQTELQELAQVAAAHPQLAEKIEPTQFGFVCSTEQWQHHWHRTQLLGAPVKKQSQPHRSPLGPSLVRQSA